MFTGVMRKVLRSYAAPTAIAAIAAVAAVPAASADEDVMQVRYTATFSQEDLVFGTLMGYDTVGLEGAEVLNVPGEPMLPAAGIRVALPAGMAVTGITVADVQTTDIEGDFQVFPAQPPQRMMGSLVEASFIDPDQGIYGSAEVYPASPAEFTSQSDLAGQAMAGIRLFPVQYIPSEGSLKLCTSIELIIEGTSGYECGDYMSPNLSKSSAAAYERMVSDMVVNPQDVNLVTADSPANIGKGVGAGDYEFVIITQDSWVDDFQPLADWKNQRGITTTIVTTDWIYNDGGYSGTNADKIQDFVIDANGNWGTMYFLLGGDTGIIPYYSRYMQGDNIPNDTYYGDYDYDYVCEVHVGRASARYTSHVTNFISKVLTYEQDPPLTNYGKAAAFFGFDLTSNGSGEGEDLMIDVHNYYMPSGWLYRSEYDSESGSHKTDVVAYLNAGNNIANHADHSDWDMMGVGYTNHYGYLSNTDMTNLHNDTRQTIMYSLGCWACAYEYTTCIAEAFVQDTNGGGVGFVGNSRYGWYYQYQDDQLSFRFDRYFFRSMWSQSHYILGECFSDHKNDVYISDNYYRYIFLQLNLLGDPTLRIWSDDPADLSVDHDDTVNVGEATTFDVEVTSGGSAVSSATVCLWKDGDIHEVGTTNTSGLASFSINPDSVGTLYVTATKHNYIPEEGLVDVVEGSNCPEDVNGDDNVDIDDLFDVLAHWGEAGGQYDANDDGLVDIDDVFAILAAWGPCP